MKFFIVLTIFILNLFSIHASIEKDYLIKAENEFDIIDLLELALNIPDEFTIDEIIIAISQTAILETVNPLNKPDNYDDLVKNWIGILNELAANGTGSVLIQELKPYKSNNFFDSCFKL